MTGIARVQRKALAAMTHPAEITPKGSAGFWWVLSLMLAALVAVAGLALAVH
jgi:hypothetical protein